MLWIRTALVAALVGAASAPAAAGDKQGFHLSAPGVEINIVPDGQKQGFRGSFRFGEGADAIVGHGHFGTSGTLSWSPGREPNKSPECPAGQVLRDGTCTPPDQ
jgi:hypothetical protein